MTAKRRPSQSMPLPVPCTVAIDELLAQIIALYRSEENPRESMHMAVREWLEKNYRSATPWLQEGDEL